MKYTYSIVLSLFLLGLVSCSENGPSKEEMQNRQSDYETKKAELDKNKGQLFKEKKAELFKIVGQFEAILDTSNTGDATNEDKYFKLEESIIEIPNKLNDPIISNNQTASGYIDIQREKDNDVGVPDVVSILKSCRDSNDDSPCLSIPDEAISNFLQIKYIFISELILDMAPKMEGTIHTADNFENGLKIESTICYELGTKVPFYSYMTSATNSESVYITEGSELSSLNSDLIMNYAKEAGKSRREHFNILSE